MPVLHITFATDDRILVTTAEEARIYDDSFTCVGIIPCIDSVGYVSAHGLPGDKKVLTIAANHVMREWWLDDEDVMDAARHMLGR